jgi:hypothetical protein
MKSKHLNYFRGKVCSLFTNPINRNFKEENPKTQLEQNIMYFVGVVEDVDEYGIFFTQIQTGLKSYFFLNNLVAICEEEVLDPSNEKDAKVINTVKEKDKEIREMMSKYESNETQGFLNIDQLAALTKGEK